MAFEKISKGFFSCKQADIDVFNVASMLSKKDIVVCLDSGAVYEVNNYNWSTEKLGYYLKDIINHKENPLVHPICMNESLMNLSQAVRKKFRIKEVCYNKLFLNGFYKQFGDNMYRQGWFYSNGGSSVLTENLKVKANLLGTVDIYVQSLGDGSGLASGDITIGYTTEGSQFVTLFSNDAIGAGNSNVTRYLNFNNTVEGIIPSANVEVRVKAGVSANVAIIDSKWGKYQTDNSYSNIAKITSFDICESSSRGPVHKFDVINLVDYKFDVLGQITNVDTNKYAFDGLAPRQLEVNNDYYYEMLIARGNYGNTWSPACTAVLEIYD